MVSSLNYAKIAILLAVLLTSADGRAKPNRMPLDPKLPGYPIVLVPGDGGSQFEAKLVGKPEVVHYVCRRTTDDYFTIWLNLQLFVPYAIDCWVDNMKLVFNTTTNKTSDMPGVIFRVPEFGNTTSLEWLDPSKTSAGLYFSTIVEQLVAWGYRRGKDIRGAPVDWRRAPNEFGDYYANLKQLIEETYRYNSNKKVVIVAHSMGSPMMLYFYNYYVTPDWKAKFIRSHFSLAGAWGGAVQIMRLYASGYNMNHYRIVLPPNKLREMQRSFTSSTFLMPSYNVWSVDEIIAETVDKSYSLANLSSFFTDINYEIGWNMYENVGHLLGNLTAPGIEVYCIYGYDIQTPEKFVWAKGYFPDYQPTTQMGDGDGTVNRRSLESCGRWNSTNNGLPVHMHAIRNAEHMEILQNSEAIQLLKSALYDGLFD